MKKIIIRIEQLPIAIGANKYGIATSHTIHQYFPSNFPLFISLEFSENQAYSRKGKKIYVRSYSYV